MSGLKNFLVIGIFTFAALSAAVVAAAPPDLVIKNLHGNDVPVSQYVGKGKWTVVMLWAHNCPICNQEVQNMAFFHEDHKDRDATVLGVSVDGMALAAKAQGFVRNHALDFPNLIIEPDQGQLAKFGGGPFIGTPTFYIYSPEGKLEAKHVGPINTDDLDRFLANRKQARLTE